MVTLFGRCCHSTESQRSRPLPTERGPQICGVQKTSDLSATVAVILVAISLAFVAVARQKYLTHEQIPPLQYTATGSFILATGKVFLKPTRRRIEQRRPGS